MERNYFDRSTENYEVKKVSGFDSSKISHSAIARIGDVHAARRQLPVIFGTSGRRVAPDRNLMSLRTPSRFIIM